MFFWIPSFPEFPTQIACFTKVFWSRKSCSWLVSSYSKPSIAMNRNSPALVFRKFDLRRSFAPSSNLKSSSVRPIASSLSTHDHDHNQNWLQSPCNKLSTRPGTGIEWIGKKRINHHYNLLLGARQEKLDAIYEEIEANMTLIGATAIEDKLQVGYFNKRISI